MPRSVNKAILIGNLGKDPELKEWQPGQFVCKFPIATEEQMKNKQGDKVTKTEWHNIVAWGKNAEICGKWLKKGKKVYIEGKMQMNIWDDKETGLKRYSPEVHMFSMVMLSSDGDFVAVGKEGSSESTDENPLEVF